MVFVSSPRLAAAATVMFLCIASSSDAATVTAISDSDFNSTNVILDQLMGPLGASPVYDFTNGTLLTSNDAQLARSPISFVGGTSVEVTFAEGYDVFEVGAWYGNDDDTNPFLQDAIFFLEIFNSAGTLLGSDQVDGQGNDLIDSFLGLRSDTPIASAVFRSYSDYVDRGAFVALDDFRFGYETETSVIPLPAALPLMATGLGILAFAGWRRRSSEAS